ncbi:MAG: YraN family protein [Clostridia bacterium]|nr:YraN family protein [Clostridia bacterium]
MAVEKRDKPSRNSRSERDVLKKELGRGGEKQACKYLKKQGYKIVETNYKHPFGEADIIASKDGVLAFIEVKTRLSDIFGIPSEAVDYHKRRRYIQAAKYYFLNREPDCTVRFDIIEIFRGQINHIENAFYEGM